MDSPKVAKFTGDGITGMDYLPWKTQMESLLAIKKVEKGLEIHYLNLALGEAPLNLIKGAANYQQAIQILDNMYLRTSQSAQASLFMQLINLKMSEGETINQFCLRFSNLAQSINNISIERLKGMIFMSALHPSMQYWAQALTAAHNDNTTLNSCIQAAMAFGDQLQIGSGDPSFPPPSSSPYLIPVKGEPANAAFRGHSRGGYARGSPRGYARGDSARSRGRGGSNRGQYGRGGSTTSGATQGTNDWYEQQAQIRIPPDIFREQRDANICIGCGKVGHSCSHCYSAANPNQIVAVTAQQDSDMAQPYDEGENYDGYHDEDQDTPMDEHANTTRVIKTEPGKNAPISFFPEESPKALPAERNHKEAPKVNHPIFDSGASKHMTYDMNLFTVLRLFDNDSNKVTIGDGKPLDIKGMGSITLNTGYILHNVLFVPKLTFTLISISSLCTAGLDTSFLTNGKVVIQHRGREVLTGFMTSDGLFILDVTSNTLPNHNTITGSSFSTGLKTGYKTGHNIKTGNKTGLKTGYTGHTGSLYNTNDHSSIILPN